MRVDCALLCDAATVREGLLHVLGGGVTRLARPGFPARVAPLALAVRILVHPTEADRQHHLEVRLQGADGEEVAKVNVDFGVSDPGDLEPGEEVPVPLPLNLPPELTLAGAGRYSFELLIDGVHRGSVPFAARLAQQR